MVTIGSNILNYEAKKYNSNEFRIPAITPLYCRYLGCIASDNDIFQFII